MKQFLSKLIALSSIVILGVQCSSQDDAQQPAVVTPPPDCLVKSIKTIWMANVDSVVFTHDDQGRIATATITRALSGPFTTPQQFTFTYYKDRLPLEIATSTARFVFEYDASDRVTSRKYYQHGSLNFHDDFIYNDANQIKQMLRYDGAEISNKYYYDYASTKNPVLVIDSVRDVSNKFVFSEKFRFTVDGADKTFAGIDPDFFFNVYSLTYYGFGNNVIGIGQLNSNNIVQDYINMFGPGNTYNAKNFPTYLTGNIKHGGNTGRISRTFTYECK